MIDALHAASIAFFWMPFALVLIGIIRRSIRSIALRMTIESIREKIASPDDGLALQLEISTAATRILEDSTVDAVELKKFTEIAIYHYLSNPDLFNSRLEAESKIQDSSLHSLLYLSSVLSSVEPESKEIVPDVIDAKAPRYLRRALRYLRRVFRTPTELLPEYILIGYVRSVRRYLPAQPRSVYDIATPQLRDKLDLKPAKLHFSNRSGSSMRLKETSADSM